MTELRADIPVPAFHDYKDPENTRQDVHRLYRDSQAKRHRIFKTAPLAHQLTEGEIVLFDDEAGDERIYAKINGTIRSVAFL